MVQITEENMSQIGAAPTMAGLVPSCFDNVIFGFAVIDKAFHYIYINETLARMNGVPCSDHIGKSVQAVLPEMAEDLLPLFRKVLDSGRPLRCEVSGETNAATGWKRHWTMDVFPIRGDYGDCVAVGITVVEDTALKNAQREIEKGAAAAARQKDQLDSIVRNIPGMVWEAWGRPDRPDQRIGYVSDYVEKLLGYSVEDWLSKPNFWLTIVAPEDKARMAALSGEAFAAGKDSVAEFRWIHKDGHRVWVEARTTVITDDNGVPVGVRGVNVDITERKLLEEQLRQAQKLEAIGLLAGGIAHDFNNLLTVIGGYADLALASLQSEDLRRKLEEIKSAGSRAAALTRQLLIFSRKQITQPVVVSLNGVVREIQKMLGRLIGENIELKTVLQADLANVRMDRGQIDQVLMNLVVNARDAMPHGGKITIETANVAMPRNRFDGQGEGEDSYVLLAVTDTGIGMDMQTRSRIFEPFFTTKEQGKGTGLGLSTVYGIVRQAKGTISVYSEPGLGTTFKIYLPASDACDARISAAIPPADLRGTGTILLVEDEEGVRNVTRSVLESRGYKVLAVGNAEEASLLVEKNGDVIDLLLTDIVLPCMDGLQLARLLKHDLPELKTLYMSGYTDNALIHRGLMDGSMAFLQKPFDAETLGRKVKEVLHGN